MKKLMILAVLCVSVLTANEYRYDRFWSDLNYHEKKELYNYYYDKNINKSNIDEDSDEVEYTYENRPFWVDTKKSNYRKYIIVSSLKYNLSESTVLQNLRQLAFKKFKKKYKSNGDLYEKKYYDISEEKIYLMIYTD